MIVRAGTGEAAQLDSGDFPAGKPRRSALEWFCPHDLAGRSAAIGSRKRNWGTHRIYRRRTFALSHAPIFVPIETLPCDDNTRISGGMDERSQRQSTREPSTDAPFHL